MMQQGDDLNPVDEGTPPEESSNRTFLIAAGVLGGIVLLSLLCLGGYALFSFTSGNQQRQAQQAQEATLQAQASDFLTQTAVSIALSQTALPSATVPPSATPPIAQPTATLTATPDPATATVAAAFTQIAASTQTIIPTSTALPGTGIADEVGAPGLAVMAIALVAIILLVRRLRAAPVK